MNLIIKRYKILIISFSMFFLIFNCFIPQKANAVVGVDDAIVVGGVTVTTECVAILVGTTLVAGGTYLASNIDSTDIHYIAQGMINAGNSVNDFAIKVANTGQKFLTWTKEGFSNFCSTVQDFFDNGVVIPSTSSSYSSVSLSQVDGLSCTINVGGEIDVFWYTNENYHVGTNNFSGSAPISVRYVLDGNDLLFYVNGSLASTTYMSSSYKGLQLKLSEGSVCVQPTISKDFNPSICPDSLTGANNSPITNGVPLSSDVLESDGSVAYTPSIDMPWERDWGSISSDLDIPINTDTDTDTDVPSDTTGDITGEGGSWVLNIPILGDILKVLLKILELLKTFVKTLIDAFVSAITTLFVPSDTYFTDKFDGYRTTLIGKLGDNNFDFLQQSGSNIEDIYINIFGQQVCIVRITLFNKFKDFAFIVIRAFFYFFLILFNFNQVIKFLRGSIFSDYNSRESMAILQNNDNLDKIINNV